MFGRNFALFVNFPRLSDFVTWICSMNFADVSYYWNIVLFSMITLQM